MAFNVGIHSVGTYFPGTPRQNDWWPSSVIEGWKERAAYKLLRAAETPEEAKTEGARKSLAAIKRLGADPFMGVKQRYIIPDDMFVSDMETHASRDAIQRAGIDPQEIDLVLGYSEGPDFQLAP